MIEWLNGVFFRHVFFIQYGIIYPVSHHKNAIQNGQICYTIEKMHSKFFLIQKSCYFIRDKVQSLQTAVQNWNSKLFPGIRFSKAVWRRFSPQPSLANENTIQLHCLHFHLHSKKYLAIEEHMALRPECI